MKLNCPNCQLEIPADQTNISADVAICENCNETFTVSMIVHAGSGTGHFDIHQPPQGAWYFETATGWEIGASTRSAIVFFLVPFMCVWSGGSLSMIYGQQIIDGEFNLFMSLFGLPFLIGSIWMSLIILMSVYGKIIVTVDENDGRIFAGIGNIGWTHRFAWDSVFAIEEMPWGNQRGNNSWALIALVGQKRTKFGSLFNEGRRYYVMQSLRVLLANRGKRR